MSQDSLARFVGLDRAGMASLKVETGQADVVTGATESGKALKQAVLNALDQKEGKTFMSLKKIRPIRFPLKPMVTERPK